MNASSTAIKTESTFRNVAYIAKGFSGSIEIFALHLNLPKPKVVQVHIYKTMQDSLLVASIPNA